MNLSNLNVWSLFIVWLFSLNLFAVVRIDFNDRRELQVIIDREPGQYLGHPSTCLLEDGKTILCVYPKGHGRGAIVYKKSVDGGLTWSERLPTPKSWETSKETPTIHRVISAEGKKRLILWSGLYPARFSISEDDGTSWSELKQAGDWGGIVVMGSVLPLNQAGGYIGLFHDDGRYLSSESRVQKPMVMTLLKTFSYDGGLSWSKPEIIFQSSQIHLCEPGAIRSPDGKEIAVLLRENARRKNSHIIFSTDEGKTFTQPAELPSILTGDRHTAKYAPDGRLLISFRKKSPAKIQDDYEGDWVAWVGSYADLKSGGLGQCLVRLKDNLHNWDCAYPGVEVLADGTFVLVTYGHWDKGEQPYILCVRFKLHQIDEMIESTRGISEKQ
ncbi:MAG: sialidase family protein [Verrucomicrobiia bacterium]